MGRAAVFPAKVVVPGQAMRWAMGGGHGAEGGHHSAGGAPGDAAGAVPVPDASKFTEAGAPTDAAHGDAGDGTLAGSTPAGLTVDELLEQASSGKTDDGGTG